MADHGSQSCASEAETRKWGEPEYEKMAEPGIKQMSARARHPQTSGRLERLPGGTRRKPHRFEASSYGSAANSPENGRVGGPSHTEPAKPALEGFMERRSCRRATPAGRRSHAAAAAEPPARISGAVDSNAGRGPNTPNAPGRRGIPSGRDGAPAVPCPHAGGAASGAPPESPGAAR